MATHIFTSAAANYLPKARVLAQSIRRFHPDWKIHLILCDRPPADLTDPNHFDFIWGLKDLEIPNLKSWLFQHTLVEASTAVKGFALRKLLSLPDCDHVVYFDPDIVVLSPLAQLVREFERASILLTPHITEVEESYRAIVDNELNALLYGIYNLGFIGVKNSPEGKRFASWWCERLEAFCFDDKPRGLFTDQRWADLVPAFFPDHLILRDPAYNVCTWNLTHRTVTGSLSDGLLVNGNPIGFYHFSGLDSGSQQGMLDRYGSEMPALYELREWYLNSCVQADGEQFSRLPWAYDYFDNGERILGIHRLRYRESASVQALFPDPFVAGDEADSYLAWFNRHDELRPVVQQANVEAEAIPEYRIVVLAAGQDAAYCADTCLQVVRASYKCSNAVLLLSADLPVQGAIPAEFQVIKEQAFGYSALTLLALQRFGSQDLLLIRAGGLPPSFWDLRLAWSAARQPGALSVAPLDRRLLDPSGVFRNLDDKTLDCFCYWYRRPSDEEAATFDSDCVYIRAAALADIMGSRMSASISDLVTQADRLRYSNVVATHLCVGWKVPRQAPDLLETPSSNRWSIRQLRNLLRSNGLEQEACPIPAVTPGTQPTLHISHSWGGGIERWLSEFADADQLNENLVLKSQGPPGSYGTEVHLYRYGRAGTAPELLRTWPLKPAIKATDIQNDSYVAVLGEIFRQYTIGKIVVSSVIGHSLECLKQPVPTAFVCHDYYPFCSAVSLSFGEVCSSCEVPRLRACLEENPLNRSFPNVPVPEWLAIRRGFVRVLNERTIPLIAPSPSVKDNYSRALPEVSHLFRVIPHGMRPLPCRTRTPSSDGKEPLRVLVLGSMALHKGRLLLEALLPELLEFAEVTLAGCFDFPEPFLSNPRIRVIPSYDRESLCGLVEEIRPDVGLLLSIFPETFSYTLHELQSMGIPPVATRIGSFADWIHHGENGFLADPQPQALVEVLRSLDDDRSRLQTVERTLQNFVLRSPEEMIGDYRRLSETRYSAQLYFDGPSAPAPLKHRGLQLYWRTRDEEFSERNSVTAFPRGSSRQTLRLDFVSFGASPAELRLDLATRPGFLLLHRVALIGRNGETLWTMDASSASLGDSHLVQCFAVTGRAHDGDGVLLCLVGNDPHLTLPIPAAALAELKGAGTIEVDFTPEPDAEILPERNARGQKDIDLLALQFGIDELAAALTRAREEVSAAQARSAQVREELEQREQAIHALQQSVSWKITKPLRTLAHAGRKSKDQDGDSPK